jgi:hypothetical protein
MTGKKRTIKTVKNRARNSRGYELMQTGISRKNQAPPISLYHMLENKTLSPAALLRPDITNELHAPNVAKPPFAPFFKQLRTPQTHSQPAAPIPQSNQSSR